jgi:Competence protein CoiA-like family
MMTSNTHILLGAFNKLTREYVYPKIADKKDNYVCIDCNKELILCQGEIRVHHFRHHIDTTNPCNYYSSPSESQIHKDAKMLIKSLLERKIPLSFLRNCGCCKKMEEFEIPEMTDTSSIILEYRFQYDGLKIADVAYLDNNELLCIFEICNTHKTCGENRPEPWFEIDATQLINMVNCNENHYKIPCTRSEKCDECIETDKIKRIKEIE